MHLPSIARRYLSAGWRHRWKALLLAWLICIPGWIAVYSLPSQYQASARIYADAEAILGALLRGIAVDNQTGSQVEMLQRTLLSRPNIERVIAKTDLDLRVTDLASRERLIEDLQRSIKLTPQTRQLFRIDYTDRDPRMAHAVVRTLIDLFMESATSSDRQQMLSARNFLNQQIVSYERQLREAEQRRAEFNARYVDILPSAALGGSSRLEAMRERVTDLRGQLQDARARRDLLNQQLQATPATLAEAQAAAGGGGGNPRIAEAERALRELRLRYTDQHPDVVAQRNIIAELRAGGGGGGGGGGGTPRTAAPATPRGGQANPLHEQLKLRLVDADSQVTTLERQVRDAQVEVERLDTLARTAPMVLAESQNMDRDYQVLRKNYEELLARRESLQIAATARTDADRVRLEVVDPPVVPTVPTGPNRLLFASGVLVAGLGAGLALVFLLIQLDRGFYTIHDLRGLGLPVLGGVSSATPPKRKVFAGLVFAGGCAMLLMAFGGMLAGGPRLIARLPDVVTRLLT